VPTSKGKGKKRGWEGKGRGMRGRGKGRGRREGKRKGGGVPPLLSLHFKHCIMAFAICCVLVFL